MDHVVSFSGGKDSTALLLKMIERGMEIDEIVFVDTTKEFPEIYDHIEQVEENIPYDITRIEFDWEYWFRDHVKTKGKNKGDKGYGWPQMGIRWCTARKRDLIRKHLSGSDYISYEGIAYDERKRAKNNEDDFERQYPLVEWEVTEAEALNYCKKKGYNWNGLYDKMHRASCYLCPMQSLEELRYVYEDYPKLWAKMKSLDETTDRQFRSDYSLQEIENKFNKEKRLVRS